MCVTAPAVRVAIGEELGLAPGSVATGQMVTAQHELGFNYVFDVNFAGMRLVRCCSCCTAVGAALLLVCHAPLCLLVS